MKDSHFQNKPIKSINKIISIWNKSPIWSILKLSDSRIAAGGANGSIKIYTVNLKSQIYELDIEQKIHDYDIYSLCELPNSKIISSSGDKTLKIFQFSKDELSHIKTLISHNKWVIKVLLLTNNLIISSSFDQTLKIWESNEPYEQLTTIKTYFIVYSILQLKNQEVLVIGGDSVKIEFWNLNTFVKENSVQCCGSYTYCGLIELPNNLIAVSGGDANSIDIIDSVNRVVIKQIEDTQSISGRWLTYSALQLFNEHSFIYAHHGCLCQISMNNFELIYKVKVNGEFKGTNLIIMEGDHYILGSNFREILSVFQVTF